MGKAGDFSPRKKGQVNVLLKHSALKIVKIAKTLNVLTRTIGQIEKKLRNNEDLEAKRVENAEENAKPPPGNRRSSCRKISSGLVAQELVVHRRKVNRRLCECARKPTNPHRNLV